MIFVFITNLFYFSAMYCSVVWYIPQFVNPFSIDLFVTVVIMNNTVMNIGAQIFLWDYVFFIKVSLCFLYKK